MKRTPTHRIGKTPAALAALAALLLTPATASAARPSPPPPVVAVQSHDSRELLAICERIETLLQMRTLAQTWSDLAPLRGVLGDGVFDAIVDASIRQMEAYADLLQEASEDLDSFVEENEDAPDETYELRRVYCLYIGEVTLHLTRLQSLAAGRDPADDRERGDLNPLLYESLRFRHRSAPSRRATLRTIHEIRNALRD